MYSVGCPHFTFIYIEMYGKCPYSLGNFLWSRAWLANFLLEGIHKIRWQDLWPPPLSVKRFATKAYIVSLTFGYPLLLLACQRSLWIFPCSLTPITGLYCISNGHLCECYIKSRPMQTKSLLPGLFLHVM